MILSRGAWAQKAVRDRGFVSAGPSNRPIDNSADVGFWSLGFVGGAPAVRGPDNLSGVSHHKALELRKRMDPGDLLLPEHTDDERR